MRGDGNGGGSGGGNGGGGSGGNGDGNGGGRGGRGDGNGGGRGDGNGGGRGGCGDGNGGGCGNGNDESGDEPEDDDDDDDDDDDVESEDDDSDGGTRRCGTRRRKRPKVAADYADPEVVGYLRHLLSGKPLAAMKDARHQRGVANHKLKPVLNAIEQATGLTMRELEDTMVSKGRAEPKRKAAEKRRIRTGWQKRGARLPKRWTAFKDHRGVSGQPAFTGRELVTFQALS